MSSSELVSPSAGVATETVTQQSRAFFTTLLGEERPKDMLALLAVLVLLLHVWGLIGLLQPVEQTTPAQPLVMEVSMIAIAAPKPSVAPPRPLPPPEKKLPPQRPKAKPIPKTPPPVVQKAPDFAPVEQVVEPQPVAQTAPAQTSTESESKTAATTQTEQFTEANFRANYAHNPKPEYPSIAKSRGWQGKVMLRVQVSAEGLSDAVAIEQSSGHEILDESAIEAVKKWRFIPAKRGETPVASSVIVPIIFTLRE